MRSFVVIRKNDSGLIDGYFDGSVFSESSSDCKLFLSPQDARAQAGILQKDELESDVLVREATVTLSIDF